MKDTNAVEDAATVKTASRTHGRGKLVLWGLLVVGLLVLAKALNAQALLRSALDWIQALGPWGPVMFVLLYILATVLFLPGSILTLGAGVVFGVLKGAILVSISATLGATAAFFVGRYLARGWVSKQIEGNATFKAIDEAVAHEGWKIVGLTRLSPVFPFNLLNYAFGVTRVSPRDYILASWIGMMPGTLMYVYIGSLAGSLATLGAEQRVRTQTEWALYVVGLLATVAVTLYVTRIARAALRARIAH
jgi:uncharacterized membrane protein YdjX (TVP38/TMEM64 family)